MKVIASVNGKGGVGKTTLLLGLALYCVNAGKRVLLADLDNQANLTGSLMDLDESIQRQNTFDLMNGEAVQPVHISENLDLIPATNELLAMDRSSDLDLYFQLSDELKSQFSEYDLILLDTPGNLGSRVTAALTAADLVFCPTELNNYSAQALLQLNALIVQVRKRFNSTLLFAGVVANQVNGVADGFPVRPDEKEIYTGLLSKSPDKVLGVVGKRACIARSFSDGKMLEVTDDSSRKAVDEVAGYSERILRLLG